jgi:hypothetical protein
MKITYFFPKSVQTFYVVTTCEFSIYYKVKVQMSTNYKKMMLKFVVLSIALARQGTILQEKFQVSSTAGTSSTV